MGNDIKLQCKDCGKEFVFSAGEQEFYKSHNLRPPIRCQDCRKRKKAGLQKPAANEFSQKQNLKTGTAQYEIVCSSCNKTTKVPFKPRNPVGILCAECFDKKQ